MTTISNSSSPTLTDVNFTHESLSPAARIDALADPPLGSTAVERRTGSDQNRAHLQCPWSCVPTKSNIYQCDPQICSVLTTKVRRRLDDRDLKRGSNVTA